MPICFRLFAAELIKLRRSVVLRLLWLFPLVFLLINFFVFERFLLSIQSLPPELRLALPGMPIRALSVIWAGLFHPLLLALVPVLLLRPEHLGKQWKHLHALPIARRSLFLAKAGAMLLVFGLVLGLAAVGLRVEWLLLARFKPLFAFPFPWAHLLAILGWSYLGSLPLLGLYLWLADRISNSAIPTLLGVAGLLLTISIGGQEMDPLWKRDLIPWILPYTCAQLGLQSGPSAHIASTPFRRNEPKPLTEAEQRRVVTRPDGSQVTILVPVLPPPLPTPTWVLATYSLATGALFLGLGLAGAGRDRS